MQGNDYFLAKTFHGLEPILAEELRALGAADVKIGKRMVRFHGDQVLLYKVNLYARTALKVLVPIKTFRARSDQELYQEVKRIQWRQFMRVQDTLALDAVVHSSYFRHSQYVALKCKDAIVDQFRERTGERPSVDTRHPHLRIHIHIFQDQITLYRDSSGESLHRRGYRQSHHPAPINEVLAAGMILLSRWKGVSPFVDPMCGSGTIAIEAALIAARRPPGLGRRFGFESWPDFNAPVWEDILAEAKQGIRPIPAQIIAADQSPAAIQEARETIRHAGLSQSITLVTKPWSQLLPPDDPGTVIINPPYGERMQGGDIFELYQSLGDRLKRHFPGWEAWIISSNFEALKKVGLKPDRKLELFNGPLPCRFLAYDLYLGSREPS